MRVYMAGPMFTAADKAWNLGLARRLRGHGFGVFCPNESEPNEDTTRETVTARLIYDVDIAALESCNVVLMQVSEDSGANWEAGYFDCLSRRVDPARYYGIVGLATDFRLHATPDPLRRGMENQAPHVNALVAGGLQASLGAFLREEDAIARLLEVRMEREGG
ncbi:MAG: nucleoside 2-deoxyribosyltransferase [Chloroflexota bacterium]